MNSILADITSPIQDSDANSEKTYNLAKYLIASKNQFKSTFFSYYICDLMYLVLDIVILVITDDYIGGDLFKYRHEAFYFFSEDQESRSDGFRKHFPHRAFVIILLISIMWSADLVSYFSVPSIVIWT